MPEFQMPYGSPDAKAAFDDLDAFTRGYVEAMFFTDTGTGDDGELEDAGFEELSDEALDLIKRDCAQFQKVAQRQLEIAYAHDTVTYDAAQAGRDLWFTRNGHGVGFWDRGLGDIGDELKDLCGWRSDFPELTLYRGDDDKLYLM